MNLGTLRKILVTLGQILSYGVRHKYLDHNPLKEAERPRGQERRRQGRGRKDFNACPIKCLLRPGRSPKYRTLFMLAIFTGARQGELLGLKWGDIDWADLPDQYPAHL